MITTDAQKKVYSFVEQAQKLHEELVKDEVLVSWSDANNNDSIIRLASMIQDEEALVRMEKRI